MQRVVASLLVAQAVQAPNAPTGETGGGFARISSMIRTFALVGLLCATGCTTARSSEGGSAVSSGTTPPAGVAPGANARPPGEGARASAETYRRPSEAELRARLTPLQYEVTQRAATEPPFRNAYWDNHADGIYVDIVSGEPLFSSRDKFDSGTGWPSFTRTLVPNAVIEHVDGTLGMERTEVVSRVAGSHLGHVFDDGPPPTHRRYCMNSASLRFVSADRLAAEGYGAFATQPGKSASAAPAPPSEDATANACAVPPPGEKPGCNSTFEVAVFAGRLDDAALQRTDGVLEVVRGHVGADAAVEVTFDPARIGRDEVVRAWSARKAKLVADGSAFRRD
jgi:peptide methionine sulfoxide reductase msrA/msrB